jgi:predicted lipid-binding transport protein (Tim44 family)
MWSFGPPAANRMGPNYVSLMGDGIQFLDIIFFAMVAGFIFLRLRSVLGRRTGNERHRPDAFGVGRPAERSEEAVALPDRTGKPAARIEAEGKSWMDNSPAGAGLTQIKIADRRFDPAVFLEGAKQAYEMIVAAFAKGDRETLRMLLADDVHDNFISAIEERERQGQTLETTITAIKSADIAEARLDGKQAEITVKFVSDMVSVARDAQGEPVGGPGREREVTDIWSFGRDLSSKDPNWLLIATRSES